MKLLGRLLPLLLLVLMLIVSMQFVLFTVWHAGKKQEFRCSNFLASSKSISKLILPQHQLYKDNAHYVWHDRNRELEIDGHFFEVVKIQLVENTAELILLEDTEEDKLYKQFLEREEQSSSNLGIQKAHDFFSHFEVPSLLSTHHKELLIFSSFGTFTEKCADGINSERYTPPRRS